MYSCCNSQIGHQVAVPPQLPRIFRRQLSLRIKAATNTSQSIPPASHPQPGPLTAKLYPFLSQVGDWCLPKRGDATDIEILTVDELAEQLQAELEEVKQQAPKDKDSTKSSKKNIWKFLKPVPAEEIHTSRVMSLLSNASYYIHRLQFKSVLKRYGLNLVTTSLRLKEQSIKSNLAGEALITGDGMAVSKAESIEEDKPASDKSNIVAASELRPQEEPRSQSSFNVKAVAEAVYAATLAQIGRQFAAAATISQSAVTETALNFVKLLQAKRSSPAESEGNVAGPKPAKSKGKCPTEWFVCDDPKKETRIICIQGTDSFESWQTNLAFDPVPFEDPSLEARVSLKATTVCDDCFQAHRGAYEAAERLYKVLLPLVKDHIQSGSKKKISFAAHSLGGGIASLLLVMMVHRGDLPVENVGQVYTFGGAASICDSLDCCTCPDRLNCECSSGEKGHHRGILEKVGLPSNTIINIFMHKDIVPRAYSCDYSLVRGLLTRWNSFRQHSCLANTGRAMLYNIIGEVQVLQPDERCHFVQNEGYHPMLPAHASLFKITDPDRETERMARRLRESVGKDEAIAEEVETKAEAFLALMDNPHPLDILGETTAYGVNGSISRYHNPLNYAKALRSVAQYHKKKPGKIFGFPL